MRPKQASNTRVLTRRRFLVGAGASAVVGALSGFASKRAAAKVVVPPVTLGSQPAGLPVRQHAWARWLRRDQFGNPLAPRFDRLLFFDVRGRPKADYPLLLESRLRTLERRFGWGPQGLLFTVSYGPDYFTRVLGVPSPIPMATGLSSFESPAIDRYQVCVHLACDDESRLGEAEALLELGSILIWRETRTGFTGSGLPSEHQRVAGFPATLQPSAPLFMGFKSGLRNNQATEDDVTIPAGPFAGGTTMQVSHMRLHLADWYDRISAAERVALMYSPQTSVAAARRFTTDASGNPNEIIEAITHHGVVGHAQASAQARRHGRPVIIRRDFDTVDGGAAGVHFVSIQRSIEDFVATRNAMNAAEAHDINPHITATANNGINAFIDVRRRANYIMPSRPSRAFPLLPWGTPHALNL
jgi:hypothetical protein